MRNISGRIIEQPGSIHIDEWGFAGNESSIDECSVENEDGRKRDEFSITMPNAYSVKAETENLPVHPGKCVTVRSKFSEVRHNDDHFIMTFTYPTKEPTVTVQIAN